MFNKKLYSKKVGGRMSDTKKHNLMRRLFHFLYRTKDTRYQLMSVDIECPILFFLTIDTFHVNCFDQTFKFCQH